MQVLAKYSPRRYFKLAIPIAVLAVITHLALQTCQVDFGELWSTLWVNGDVYLRFVDLDLSSLGRMLEAAATTVLLAALATPLGAVLSIVFAIAGAKNLSSKWIRLFSRLSLGLERSLPDIVVLFVFIAAFGVGVFPAVIALAIGSLGMLGKLWADAIEEVDSRALESMRASGATLGQSIRFGVLPQIASAVVSNSIFRFEVNVRAATVLGGLSGVGIGYELNRAFVSLEYGRMGMAILVIIAVVHLCERFSSWARKRILVDGGLE